MHSFGDPPFSGNLHNSSLKADAPEGSRAASACVTKSRKSMPSNTVSPRVIKNYEQMCNILIITGKKGNVRPIKLKVSCPITLSSNM